MTFWIYHRVAFYQISSIDFTNNILKDQSAHIKHYFPFKHIKVTFIVKEF